MKIAKIMLFIICILALGVFMFINQMTPIPGASSGNGNPGFFISWILLPLFYFMVILWVRIFRVHSINIYVSLICMCVIIIHLITAFSYQKSQLSDYRQVIKSALMKRNGVVDEEYVNAITEGLSIHVNNQYFNFNTYCMFLTFSIFVAIVYILWDIWEKKKEKQT